MWDIPAIEPPHPVNVVETTASKAAKRRFFFIAFPPYQADGC
jgi:hypothetical protein